MKISHPDKMLRHADMQRAVQAGKHAHMAKFKNVLDTQMKAQGLSGQFKRLYFSRSA